MIPRFAFALLLTACVAQPDAPPSQPQRVFAPIRTDKSHYAFRHAFFGPETTIIATFHAREPVSIANCNGAISNGLQRLVGGKWVQAWGAVTNACASAPIVVDAGKTHTETIILRPGVGAVIYPKEGRQLIEAGTYRVVFHGVSDLPVEQRASAPFVIEGPPPQPDAITSFEPPENAYVKVNAPLRVVVTEPVRVYVDGVEVTPTYVPPQGWTPGRHGVLVQLANGESYSWAFIAEV